MLTIQKLTNSDPIIIKMEGRIDGITSKQLQTEIDDIISDGIKNLIFDFTSINYLSSAGIRVFIATMKKINLTDGQIFFVGLTQHIYEIFKISGLSNIFKTFDNYQQVTEILNNH